MTQDLAQCLIQRPIRIQPPHIYYTKASTFVCLYDCIFMMLLLTHGHWYILSLAYD